MPRRNGAWPPLLACRTHRWILRVLDSCVRWMYTCRIRQGPASLVATWSFVVVVVSLSCTMQKRLVDADAAPLSKKAMKKQAKMQYKQQMKAEHHEKEHHVMHQEAHRLRMRLSADKATAVPDEALYRKLPRSSACELFSAIGDVAVARSIFYQRPPNSLSAEGMNVDGNTGTDADAASGDPAVAASADDAEQARSCRVIDQFMWRAHKYNEKYASQELSLLYQLYRLGAAGGCDLVIDIGAGNANLSCLIALVFDVKVICVEMDSPRIELCARARKPMTAPSERASERARPPQQSNHLRGGRARLLGPRL
jgi:hypothetical protein